EARSQLAAERTPDSPGGTAPPGAGLRDNGAPPLGGKLSRSLRSLRPIAAASVVAGPRRFPEGAWTHPVLTKKTPHPPPRRPRHTQDPAPPGGCTTPKAGRPPGVAPRPEPGPPRSWRVHDGSRRVPGHTRS